MTKKIFIYCVIGFTVVAVSAGTMAVLRERQARQRARDNQQGLAQHRNYIVTLNQEEKARTPEERQKSMVAPSASANHLVRYTPAGYFPATLTVKAGQTVVFVNDAHGWSSPVAVPHHHHEGMPDIQMWPLGEQLAEDAPCQKGDFNPCRAFEGGQAWSFRFTEAGTWRYRDRLLPEFGGTVIVE